MKTNYPLISIIISNYNGAKLNILRQCLESFKKPDYPNYELILVDNASSDSSVKVAKKIFGKNPKFKIIKNSVNMYSQGVNLGFKHSQGEYIALFNNDIEPGKKYLQKLLNAFYKYPKLAVVQGKLLSYFDHSIIDSCGETIDIFGNPVTLGYKSKDEGLFDKEEEILSATGAACLIKGSALEEVGGYDPQYGIGYEDMDHSLRFRLKGFTIMRIPKAYCYHKRGVTDLSDEVRVKVRMHFNKNRLATMIRNYPLNLLIKALPVTLLIYLSNMVWEILILRNIPLALTRLKAVWWVLNNLGYLISQRKIIRSSATPQTDKKTLILFAPSDLLGKIKAVVLDKFEKIQDSLPWTYPAEIKRLIPAGSNILDVGCGDGHLMAWINSRGEYKVVGVDINKKDLQVAKKRLTGNNKPVFEDLLLVDLTKKMPFKKEFDVVLCSQVIEHLEKDTALGLIQKIEKLAKKRVIIATINGFFQFNHRMPEKHDIHLSGWSKEEFVSRGYSVWGSGLRIIYKPGALKDITPPLLHPLLFLISYLATPLVHYLHQAALLLIAHKDTSSNLAEETAF